MGSLRNVETQVYRRIGLLPPASNLGRLAFWLALITALASLGMFLHGLPGTIAVFFTIFAVICLLSVLLPLIWRYTLGRFLWKVRNRLIVTYVLMALTPVVLFLSLAAISLYIFLGQFATFTASGEIEISLQRLASENYSFVRHVSHGFEHVDTGQSVVPDRDREGAVELAALTSASTEVSAFLDGKPLPLIVGGKAVTARVTAIPAWAPEHFRGVVIADSRLYLRAIDSVEVDGHRVVSISSMPLKRANVDEMARGLGRITIVPDVGPNEEQADAGVETPEQPAPGANTPATSTPTAGRAGGLVSAGKKHENGLIGSTFPAGEDRAAREKHADALRHNTIVGGALRPSRHIYDIPVSFYAPIVSTDWETGKSHESYMHVTSRPTLLYDRLFFTSLRIAAIVQDVLIALAIFFGLLELAAFLMAIRLNRTITESVNGLYEATVEIDSGNLTHRIEVERKDQLGALSQSFNTMSASLERLLEEQREKERLQGELEIAQEVQANLFPHGRVTLPMLELHGFSQPARIVSGDYYDFLVVGSTELSLALGDISGKGISAALLMATLHSAVRAYRFAGDDMNSSAEQAGDVQGGLHRIIPFAAPARILGLLNRHLYRSSAAEKYATLFLAHYEGETQMLTYSTGGQLPPLLLRADNSVVRLDCGGTVVGLIDNMTYEQGHERMEAGDILIAYSDGVTEPENEFGDFGEDRLLEIVRRHRNQSLEAITEHVMQGLRNWVGTQEQPDDITLVLARQR